MSDEFLKTIFHISEDIRSILEGFGSNMKITENRAFAMIVDDDEKIVGVVTDGDIRTHLLGGGSVDDNISLALNKDFIFAMEGERTHKILRHFDESIRNLPILNSDHKIVNLLNYTSFSYYAFNSSNYIRVKVPVRVTFAGGGTDFSQYMKSDNTSVLTSTINKYIYASLKVRSDKKIHIYSHDFNMEYKVENIDYIEYGDDLDLVKSVIKLTQPKFGFDLELISEFEPGTGLGGSSAVAVAVIGAINSFRNEDSLNLYGVADLAYQAERIELNMTGGWQDQYATTFGGFNWIDFNSEEIIVNPLRIDRSIINELEFNVMLFRMGGTRNSSKIIEENLKDQEKRKASTKKNIEQMLSLSTHMKEMLVKGDLPSFGKSLHTAWELKKSFGKNISNQLINTLYDSAISNGALGGKLLGAGGSGYMLVYVPFHKQKAIKELFEQHNARLQDFSFTQNGLEVWKSAL